MRITKAQFDTFYNNAPTPTASQLVQMLQDRYGWSYDYCVLVLGTTFGEGYPYDPYLLYAWCCAVIGYRNSGSASYNPTQFGDDATAWTTIYGWGAGTDWYSRENVYYHFNHPYTEALKAAYLAITNTDTNIFACSGDYYEGACYSVYHSSAYPNIWVWYVVGRPIEEGGITVTRRTSSPAGEYNPCYMSNMYGASWTDHWNTSIYGSPTSAGADVLANCVGYAQGRALEMYNEATNYDPASTGTHPFIMFNANAGEWYGIAQANGFTVSQNPAVGAVMCWGDSLGAGHVAVVEAVASNDEITTTESAYGGWAWGADWCEMTRFRSWNSNFSGTRWNMPANYNFQGFILNPAEIEGGGTPIDPFPPVPVFPVEEDRFKWWMYLKPWYKKI